MKKIRLTAFILSLASCLFLFSAGFSTWFKVVLPTDIKPGTGEFTAYSVVDVVSSGSTLNVSGFQYTSFGFVNNEGAIQNQGSISITYTFASTGNEVDMTLSYENLSGYATTDFQGLFSQILSGEGNSIQVYHNNTLFLTVSEDNIITKTEDSDVYFDQISYSFTPSTTTVEIKYVFNIANGGNFRQNLGKYLKAFTDSKTTFISTVVAAS